MQSVYLLAVALGLVSGSTLGGDTPQSALAGSTLQLTEDDYSGASSKDIRAVIALGMISKIVDPDTLEYTDTSFFKRSCLGAVIRREYPMILVTAAHCVYYKSIKHRWTVDDEYYAGISYKRDDDLSNVIFGKVLDIEFPTKTYNGKSKNKRVFGDIALVSVDIDSDTAGSPLRLVYTIPTRDEVTGFLTNSIHKNSHTDTIVADMFGWSKAGRLLGKEGKPLIRSACRAMFWRAVRRKFNEDNMPWLTKTPRKYRFLSRWFDKLRDKDPPTLYEQMRDNIYNSTVIKDDEICGFDPKFSVNNCHGDSGGPMVTARDWNEGESKFIYGVTSAGRKEAGCTPYYPVIFASIDFYRKWIDGAEAALFLKQYHRLPTKHETKAIKEKCEKDSDKMLGMKFEDDAKAHKDYYLKWKNGDCEKKMNAFLDLRTGDRRSRWVEQRLIERRRASRKLDEKWWELNVESA